MHLLVSNNAALSIHFHDLICGGCFVAVQLAAWLKKTFSLKPALNWIRKNRPDQRSGDVQTSQVDNMR
jgi:hypothetical protein